MALLLEDRVARLKRASEIISSLIDPPSSTLLRKAEELGCLFEFEALCEEARQWLDDDAYYEDFAWNLDNEQL